MKIFPLLLLFVAKLAYGRWQTDDFCLRKDQPSKHEAWRLAADEAQSPISAWVSPVGLLKTKDGAEYGYIIDSVFVHDRATGKSFHIVCNGITRDEPRSMRGVEAQYDAITLKPNGDVVIIVMAEGTVDGTLIFSTRNEQLNYEPTKAQK